MNCKCKQNTQSNMKSAKVSSHIQNYPYDDVPLSDSEKVIANAIHLINLDKSSMYSAKSQLDYDTALEDLRFQMDKIKSLASPDAYRDFRHQVGRWYRATLPYLKWDKSHKRKSHKPSKNEMLVLNACVESAKVAKSKSEVIRAINSIEEWFDGARAKYPKCNIDKLYDDVGVRMGKLMSNNPILKKTLIQASGCV